MKTNSNIQNRKVKCPNCKDTLSNEVININELIDNKEDYIEVDCPNCDYPVKINIEYDENDEAVDIDIW